jgi:uncharacterized protein
MAADRGHVLRGQHRRSRLFGDPLALSLPDNESGQGEERWVTIGRNPASNLLLVVHTYMELSAERMAIRIISARRPTRREVLQCKEG